MLRIGLTAAFAMLSVVGLNQADEPRKVAPPKTEGQTVPELIPDPKWEPKVGETASLYSEGADNVFVVLATGDPREFVKAMTARDVVGLREQAEAGWVATVPSLTKVLIVSTGSVHSGWWFLEVRMLDGDRKDQKVLVPNTSLARMIANPAVAARKSTPKAKVATPAERAAGLLQAAKNLEKAGKTKPAIENYQRIVKDFAGTPSASVAKDRLKELGMPD